MLIFEAKILECVILIYIKFFRMNLLLDLVRRNERLISEQDRGYSHYHQRQFPVESNFTVVNGHFIRRQTYGNYLFIT